MTVPWFLMEILYRPVLGTTVSRLTVRLWKSLGLLSMLLVMVAIFVTTYFEEEFL